MELSSREDPDKDRSEMGSATQQDIAIIDLFGSLFSSGRKMRARLGNNQMRTPRIILPLHLSIHL